MASHRSIEPVRALFVNSGILGQRTFARFVDDRVVTDRVRVDGAQIVVADDLTLSERLMRWALCARVWPDNRAHIRNLDLGRYRADLNAGLVADWRIRRLEQSGQTFDVLHFHRQTTAYASLGRMRRTPAIVSIDCTQRGAMGTDRSRLEERTYHSSIRRDGEIFDAAKLIIAASQWAADSIREDYPRCATDVLVLHNPVQLDFFDAAWADERHRRATASPGYRPRVLFMGGDFARKGGYELLTAWRDGRFAERASLDLVTNWPIGREWLAPGIVVHGHVASHSEAWRRLWREADVFALPTRDEAFGIVFQEAAAAALPAIGTSINAIPELVVDGATGILVEPGRPDQIACALHRLVESADLRRAFGAHARKRVERSADPDVYRDRLVDTLYSVARLKS